MMQRLQRLLSLLKSLAETARACGEPCVEYLDGRCGESVARSGRHLRRLLLFLSAACLFFLLWKGALRARDPFFYENECWQGVQFTAAVRLLEGGTLYPEPFSRASYYSYSPGLPALTALAMRIFGVHLLTVKLLAYAFCLLNLLGVAVGAFHVTRSRWAALAAAGFLAAAYEMLDHWHFNVRPDVFGSGFSIWAILCMALAAGKKKRSLPLDWAAAVLFCGAALCKQNFIVLALVHLICLWKTRGSRYAVLAFIPYALMGGATILLFSTGEEHFVSTTLIMRGHPTTWDAFWKHYGTLDSWNYILWLLGLAGAAAVWASPRWGRGGGVWPLMFGVTFVMGCLILRKWGADVNSLFIWVALVAVLAAVSLFERPEPERGSRSLARLALAALGCCYLTLELSFHLAPQTLYHDAYRDREDLRPLYTFLQENKDKRVYIPIRNYLGYLASGQYDHCGLMTEVLYHSEYSAPEEILKKIDTRYFDIIVGGFHTHQINRRVSDNYNLLLPPPAPPFNVYVRKGLAQE